MHTQNNTVHPAVQSQIDLGDTVVTEGQEGPPKQQPRQDSSTTSDPFEVFQQLFSGRRGAYGVSLGASATTQVSPVTPEEYRRHLGSGGKDEAWSLGLNPLRAGRFDRKW